jgi:hypothetical protein
MGSRSERHTDAAAMTTHDTPLRTALEQCRDWNRRCGNWSGHMEQLVEAALASSTEPAGVPEGLLKAIGKLDARLLRDKTGREIKGAHWIKRDDIVLLLHRAIPPSPEQPTSEPKAPVCVECGGPVSLTSSSMRCHRCRQADSQSTSASLPASFDTPSDGKAVGRLSLSEIVDVPALAERITYKIQRMLTDKYTNSFLIVNGIIKQEITAALLAQTEQANKEE